MSIRTLSLTVALLVAASISMSARADVPGLLHYQGYLTDVEGTPVSGVWTVTFTFFEEQVGGQDFFSEAQVIEPDVGVFSVVLGSQPGNGIEPAWFSGGAAWLELTVDDGVADPVVLQPRQRVTSHPYAMWTDSAATCGEATNALGLGGAPAESFATVDALTSLVAEEDLAGLLEALGYTPGGGGDYGDEDVQAYLDFIGVAPGGGYTDAEVAAYLLLNGYAPGPYFDGDYASLMNPPDLSAYLTVADLADFVVGDELLGEVAASGLFLMADGSVVASGDLDIGGYQLIDVVVENASAADAPEDAVGGQLWFDTDEDALKVFDGADWVTLGAAASLTDLDCDGCVDPDDVAFGYAGAPAQGGAAFSAMGLVCEGCVEASALGISWALATSPGGDAAGLDCVGCVSLGHISTDAVLAANHVYDNTASGLNSATVQDAIDELAEVGPSAVNEGNGTIVSYVGQWGLPAYGTASQYIHLLNPTDPKVIAYLYGDQDQSFATSDDVSATNEIAPNQYIYNIAGTAGQTSFTAANTTVLATGSHVLLYRTVGTGGTGQGAGEWEVVEVVTVNGSTVTIAAPLKMSWADNGPTDGQNQGVVAATYDTLQVASGGIVRPQTTMNDNAEYGGIVYIRAGTVTVKSGGRIHADGYGFASYNSYEYVGDSHCSAGNINQRQPNCNGGGGGCCSSNCGGGGGGNKSVGMSASTYSCSQPGQGGMPFGIDDPSILTMGGAGGNADNWYNSSGSNGNGGGLVVIGAKSVVVEAGGEISANGWDGQANYCGAGAGGSVALFAGEVVNNGTIEAVGGIGHKSGSYYGGDGGEGWVHIADMVPGMAKETFPRGVSLSVDGVDVTAQIGDPNGKGAPHWDAAEQLWGADGVDVWSSGPLDLSAVGNWTLGEHRIELAETGGVGGNLKLYTYVVYPFSKSSLPGNNTCGEPQVLDLMAGGTVVVSGTTEDIMGKIKATDDYVQPFCGGSGGPDVVYQFTLTDWRRLTIDTTAPFSPRIYIRKTICSSGDAVACGDDSFVTADLKNGTYYLFVDSDGNLQKGNFTLSILAEPPSPPPNDTCAAPEQLIFQNGVAEKYGVSLFTNDDYSAGCGGAGGPDNVYSFDIPPGTQQAAVTVDADFETVIYLAKASCAGPYIACAPAAEYTIGWPEAGTYYLILDGKTPGDKGEYTINVTLQ